MHNAQIDLVINGYAKELMIIFVKTFNHEER